MTRGGSAALFVFVFHCIFRFSAKNHVSFTQLHRHRTEIKISPSVLVSTATSGRSADAEGCDRGRGRGRGLPPPPEHDSGAMYACIIIIRVIITLRRRLKPLRQNEREITRVWRERRRQNPCGRLTDSFAIDTSDRKECTWCAGAEVAAVTTATLYTCTSDFLSRTRSPPWPRPLTERPQYYALLFAIISVTWWTFVRYIPWVPTTARTFACSVLLRFPTAAVTGRRRFSFFPVIRSFARFFFHFYFVFFFFYLFVISRYVVCFHYYCYFLAKKIPMTADDHIIRLCPQARHRSRTLGCRSRQPAL